MRDGLVISVLSVLPRNRLARWLGRGWRGRWSRHVVRLFVRVYDIDVSEVDGDLESFESLEAFFTRRLVAGARPIDSTPDVLVSPADGAVAWCGRVEDGQVPLAPGQHMSVRDLVQMPCDDAVDVAVIYLSPRDYHRVHAPCDGQVVRWRYVPGTLWPVFAAAVRRVPHLFEGNERVSVQLQTDAGPLSVVMVGAFGVGRMSLAFADLITNEGLPARDVAPSPQPVLARGGDLGVFHLGSTVVMVAPAGTWSWDVQQGEAVRMGQRLATHISR